LQGQAVATGSGFPGGESQVVEQFAMGRGVGKLEAARLAGQASVGFDFLGRRYDVQFKTFVRRDGLQGRELFSRNGFWKVSRPIDAPCLDTAIETVIRRRDAFQGRKADGRCGGSASALRQ